MNMSRAISQLKMQLGLYGITLPFKDEVTGETTPTENVIRDVIVTTTIPIYSQYVPWLREGVANLNSLKRIDESKQIYLLPEFLTTTPVMYISDITMPMHSNRGTYGDIAPAYGINRSVQGVATSMAYMMVAGQMRAEPTFDDLGEKKVRLYGYPKTDLNFIIACEHEPNGETIPAGCYDSFMQLATLDVKMFLWNTLKLYDKVASAHGVIDLKIEEFQGADAERTALLAQWGDLFHLDMAWEKFM